MGNGRTYPNDFKDDLVANLHKLLIPLRNVISPFTRTVVIVILYRQVVLVILALVYDFPENYLIDLRYIC